MPATTLPGAISLSVARVTAMSAGPRVHVLTTPGPIVIRLVAAANAPRIENASLASLVSAIQADS